MINTIKLFSFLVIVCSLVIISIKVCETSKRDFKFRNIFRLSERFNNKKSKKDTKYMNRDYTISYIDGFNRHEMYARPPPLIHTLIPLPLPVHLPLPLMSENQFVDKHSGHPLLPTQTHLISNADHSLHNHHLIHDGTGEPIFAMGSNHMVESGHPLPLMVPNPVPLDMSMQLAAESEVFPVQVLPVFMKDDSFESIANGVNPLNANPIDDGFDDTVMDNMGINARNLSPKHKHRVERHKDINDNNNPNNNDNNRDESVPQSRGLKLVNRTKFNAIHRQKFSQKIESEEKEIEEDRNGWRKIDKLVPNTGRQNISKQWSRSFSYFPPPRREDKPQKPQKFENKAVVKSMDSTKRVESKVPLDAIPDEQHIDLSEDDWTFKDLDLWAVR